jgi:hypothetical protein
LSRKHGGDRDYKLTDSKSQELVFATSIINPAHQEQQPFQKSKVQYHDFAQNGLTVIKISHSQTRCKLILSFYRFLRLHLVVVSGTNITKVSIPAIQFVLFPTLPPEIRLCIWHLLVPKSRIVALNFSDFVKPSIRKRHIKCALPKPIIFDICAESRLEAHGIYTINFATEKHRSPVWIDPINDVVHLPTYGWVRFEADLYSVQHLAFDAVHGVPSMPPLIKSQYASRFQIPWLQMYEQLQTLTVVVHDGDCLRRTHVEGKENERFVDRDSHSAREQEDRMKLHRHLEAGFKNVKMDHPDWKEPITRVQVFEVDEIRCCYV